MNNRFPNNQNQIGSRLLSNITDITIFAAKTDDGMIVSYKLEGGVNFDLDEEDSRRSLGFVREILDAFERG